MVRPGMSLCRRLGSGSAALAVSLTLAMGSARADEGMWLLTKPPVEALKSRYSFDPSPAWLEAMQKSAVRFSTGGSGSFVSSGGLVMTNHHVASDTLAKLSTKERDLMKEGFLARTPEQELKCPDLELNVLSEIEDVTARVKGAAKEGASSAEANRARLAAIATIEKESKDKTGLTSQVVTLYNGGQYHLYRYQRYTDVRLVFAPEKAAAFFGGDTDNFEYPRFNLDCTFFRVYDDRGQPLKPQHHLAWSAAGAAENELIFVFGHPGRTRRGLTVDHLRSVRDAQTPTRLARLYRAEINAQQFAARSKEQARIIEEDIFGIANSRKATLGGYRGLLDPRIFGKKLAAEQELRSKVMADAKLAAEYGDAWDRIAKAQEVAREIAPLNAAYETGWTGELVAAARTIVRLAAELPKPGPERLREFGDARLESVYLNLYSPAPIYDALEVHAIEMWLMSLCEQFGGEDPTVVKLLDGKSPRARAEELVRTTTIKDIATRKKLVEGGAKAIDAAKDPLLSFVASFDDKARAARKRYENEVEAVERENYAKIAAARFAVNGDKDYPDATFSLRLSFGTVKSLEIGGAKLPAFTTLGGTFDRAAERAGQEGFDLAPSWVKAKPTMKLDTPFNFICTADIIGGNSGSPVVNKKGEVVGLIFDGNLGMLVYDFVYDEREGRALAVDSRGMIEAFKSIYNASELVKELTGK